MIHTRLDCGCLRRDACSWHTAAPAMLEALEKYADYVERIITRGDCGYFGKDEEDPALGLVIYEKARAAIKAAKGE